ncbi:MAG: tetratricopeptide repeat protein, partial [Deltaproteobacteria bacterium]
MKTYTYLNLTLLLSFTAGGQQAPKPEPVTAQQILAWSAGGMLGDHLKEEIVNRGLAFQSDQEFLNTLKDAGVEAEVVGLVAKCAGTAGESKSGMVKNPVSGHVVAGALALHQKDLAKAQSELKAALNLEPRNPDLMYALALALSRQDDWVASESLYRDTDGFA